MRKDQLRGRWPRAKPPEYRIPASASRGAGSGLMRRQDAGRSPVKKKERAVRKQTSATLHGFALSFYGAYLEDNSG